MIVFPRSIEEAVSFASQGGELRAGGTDFQERVELGLTRTPIVDLRDVPGMQEIDEVAGGLRIGARVTVEAIASHPAIGAHYPGLARAAAALATPQIRRVATLGGNLLQRSRCWYYRHPVSRCFRSGGDGCPARTGNHLYAACFDLGPCVAPHPSTLALSLLVYDARVLVAGGADRPIDAVYGDGSDAACDHRLAPTELLTAVVLPPPRAGERAAYVRATSRAHAEWPLADACVCCTTSGGRIALARVAVGGVASIPLRLRAVEARLEGEVPDPGLLSEAAALAVDGARPLPMTAYKLPLVQAVVLDALEMALESR